MHDPCKILVPFDSLVHTAVGRVLAVLKDERRVFVDATAGNGHDTVFLAEMAGKAGKVYAFDVQHAALEATRKRLALAGVEERVELIHAGHERMHEYLPVAVESVQVIVFNLGFLPGSDKRMITGATTTLAALQTATSLLGIHGLLSVHAYTGHPGGEEECRQVLQFFAELPRQVWRVQLVADGNKPRNVEWLVLAEKIQQQFPSSPQAAPSI